MHSKHQPPPSSVLSPVFRWMGSKRRDAPIVSVMVRQLLRSGTYFEPFLGGGTIALNVGAKAAVLGDINEDLMNAWRQLLHDPSALHASVSHLPVNENAYYRIRDEGGGDGFARAVRFVYLNRYCFNGIYRTNRHNVFNVPYGQATGALPSERAFQACADSLGAPSLVTADFELTLAPAADGDVAYLDPPFPASRPTYGEYGYGTFGSADLERLRTCVTYLSERGVAIVMSLPREAAEAQFQSLRARLSPRTYSVASRSHHRRSVEEALLINEVAADLLTEQAGNCSW